MLKRRLSCAFIVTGDCERSARQTDVRAVRTRSLENMAEKAAPTGAASIPDGVLTVKDSGGDHHGIPAAVFFVRCM